MDDATDTITSLVVTNDAILVGSADGYTHLYDIRQGKMSTNCMNEAVTSVAISRDMASHLISVADGTVKLIDKDSGELLACYKGHTDVNYKDYKIEVGVNLLTKVTTCFTILFYSRSRLTLVTATSWLPRRGGRFSYGI